jgi:hypothetical protein
MSSTIIDTTTLNTTKKYAVCSGCHQLRELGQLTEFSCKHFACATCDCECEAVVEAA